METAKTCIACGKQKPKSEFYKNKTKKDGLQNYCNDCGKNKWGKWFECSRCSIQFYVGHRNVSQRKTKLCDKCVTIAKTERIIAQNKANTGEFTLSQKGYKYVSDPTQKHGYKFLHRKVMEGALGRELTKEDVVHHIDGDKSNNELENLHLTTRTGHAVAHNSLEKIGFYLIREKKICFNRQTGFYELVRDSDEKV